MIEKINLPTAKKVIEDSYITKKVTTKARKFLSYSVLFIFAAMVIAMVIGAFLPVKVAFSVLGIGLSLILIIGSLIADSTIMKKIFLYMLGIMCATITLEGIDNQSIVKEINQNLFHIILILFWVTIIFDPILSIVLNLIEIHRREKRCMYPIVPELSDLSTFKCYEMLPEKSVYAGERVYTYRYNYEEYIFSINADELIYEISLIGIDPNSPEKFYEELVFAKKKENLKKQLADALMASAVVVFFLFLKISLLD